VALNKDKTRANAQKFLQKGQVDKAIKEFQLLVEDDPKDVRTLLKIGDLQTRNGDNAAATATYGKVADFYSEQGFFLKAVAVYKQILKIDPTLININTKLAELYHQLGLLSDAANQYRQISLLHEQQGKLDESLGILKKLIELDPENVAIRVKLAEIQAKQGDIGQARENFRAAANYLKTHRRVDDYVKIAERIVFVDPGDLTTTRELANIYIQKGDARRALAKLQVCFKADPKDVPTLELLANAFRDLGQTPKTISVFREIAHIHRDAGRSEAMLSVLRKLVELAPDDPEARETLGVKTPAAPSAAPPPGAPPPLGARAPLGRIEPIKVPSAPPPHQAQPGMPATAPLAKPATPAPAPVAANVDVSRMLTEAEVYVKYGLKPKAIEHLKKIVTIDPSSLEAHVRLKDLYAETGDTAAAVSEIVVLAKLAHDAGDAAGVARSLDEALTLDPGHAEALALKQELGARPGTLPPARPTVESTEPDDIELPEAFVAPSPVAAKSPAPAVPPPMPEDDSFSGSSVEIELDDTLAPMPAAPPAFMAPRPLLDKAPAKPVSPSVPHASAPPVGKPAGVTVPARAPLAPAAAAPAKKPGLLDEDEIADLLGLPEVAAKPPVPSMVGKKPAPPPAAAAEAKGEPKAEPGAADLTDEIEEVRFFLVQGLESEAQEALGRLKAEHPVHPEVLALEKEIFPETAEPAAPAEAAHVPTPAAQSAIDEEPEPEKMEVAQVDLAHELAADLDKANADYQVSFSDVFEEFKKGVAVQVEETDYETHYNLGIAYKEMGLHSDAIRELELVARAEDRLVAAKTLIGLCHIDMGEGAAALADFRAALGHARVTPGEAIALRYEIGRAFEALGEFDQAAAFFEKVQDADSKFRDVTERLTQARTRMGKAGASGADAVAVDVVNPPDAQAAADNSNKISFV